MDRTGRQALAGTALPGEQHGLRALGGQLDQAIDLPHLPAVAGK
jgi:hypothetical protein